MRKVAIFGSARTDSDSGLYKAVEKLGKNIAAEGWVVVTGGGPGTMEAANKGAMSACIENSLCSVAEAIYLPFEEGVNPYVQEYEKHQTFYSRLKTFADCDAFPKVKFTPLAEMYESTALSSRDVALEEIDKEGKVLSSSAKISSNFASPSCL